MVNVLRGGSSAVSGGIREAQGLGVARNAGELAKADAAGDALDKLRAAADGLANAFTIKLAPEITAIANTLTKAVSSIGIPSGTQIKETAAVFFGSTMKELLDGSIFREIRLDEIRQKVAEREQKRTEERESFTRRQREAETRLGKYLEERVAKQKAKAEELAQIQADTEAARIEAAQIVEQQNMSLAQQVMGMLGLDESGSPRSIAISGGAPTIMSGSAEEQLARFNSANANMQSVAEKQLTLTQRIDRAIQDIKTKAEQDSNTIRQILERIPPVQPL